MSNQRTSDKFNAINIAFITFVAGAVLFASFSDKMSAISQASVDGAKEAVQLSINLIGFMALWLGLVRVLEAGGLMHSLARAVKPVMVKLFPEVPPEHPAMSAMLLNIAANMLGLGNAATPLGIKAMVELNKLNPFRGTATNSMCLFLAINTSSVALLPLGVIGIRVAAKANDPAAIILPTLIATMASTIVGVIAAILLAKRDRAYIQSVDETGSVLAKEREEVAECEIKTGSEKISQIEKREQFLHLLVTPKPIYKIVSSSFMIIFAAGLVYQFVTTDNVSSFLKKELISFWLMPLLILLIVCYGVAKGVKVYDAVTEGAKQGFEIAVRIIPFLVAILVAVGMFNASGAMEFLARLLNPLTGVVGMPAEVLPMALVRPLSGSGAFGVMSALVQQSPNSYSAYLASTMQGSTETTFYVLAVYFGAVGVTRIRHALVAGLIADVTGILVSCLVCSLLWQG